MKLIRLTYEWATFSLKKRYLYGPTFKFCCGISLPKPNLSTPLPQKTHFLGYSAQKLKAAHTVNYFCRFLGKNFKNCPPSKLLLFTSLVHMVQVDMQGTHQKIRNEDKIYKYLLGIKLFSCHAMVILGK